MRIQCLQKDSDGLGRWPSRWHVCCADLKLRSLVFTYSSGGCAICDPKHQEEEKEDPRGKLDEAPPTEKATWCQSTASTSMHKQVSPQTHILPHTCACVLTHISGQNKKQKERKAAEASHSGVMCILVSLCIWGLMQKICESETSPGDRLRPSLKEKESLY